MMDIGFACLLMGLGIGIDVALATFFYEKILENNKCISFWLLGVTVTHTLFPMLGYILAYTGVNSLPFISPVVGLIAMLCISYFVYQEMFSADTEIDLDGKSKHLMVNLGLILAVSWDALWSGPAKSAQVVNWPEFWVWASFFIVGLVVLVFAILSFLIAKRFKKSLINETLGQWLQLSIISYFGLLAFMRYTLDLALSELWLLFMSAFLTASLMLLKTVQAARNPRKSIGSYFTIS